MRSEMCNDATSEAGSYLFRAANVRSILLLPTVTVWWYVEMCVV